MKLIPPGIDLDISPNIPLNIPRFRACSGLSAAVLSDDEIRKIWIMAEDSLNFVSILPTDDFRPSDYEREATYWFVQRLYLCALEAIHALHGYLPTGSRSIRKAFEVERWNRS